MADGPSAEFYERLPGYVLRLLDEDERKLVEQELEGSQAAREAVSALKDEVHRWASSTENHPAPESIVGRLAGSAEDADLLSHLLGCEDCRQEAEIGLTSRRPASASPSGNVERLEVSKRPWRASRTLKATAALAASLSIGLLGGWFGHRSLDPGVAPDGFRPFRLESLRDAGAMPVLRMEDLVGNGAKLQVQVRLRGDRAVWRLVKGGEVLVRGEQPFDSGPRPLRTLELYVPRDVFRATGTYVLIVEGPEGETGKRWEFEVRQ